MLKKTIKYTDLDGNVITEDFYFNLNKAEIAEMGFGPEGGSLMDQFKEIVKAEDTGRILAAFKMIVSKAYGQRSEDGKSFTKSKELSEWFLGTDAYSELFMELIQDANLASAFVRGIMPSDIVNKLDTVKTDLNEEPPAWIKENRKPTKDELLSMNKDQLLEVMRRDSQQPNE